MKDIEVFLKKTPQIRMWEWMTPYKEQAPIGYSYSYRADGLLEGLRSYNVLGFHKSPLWEFHKNGLLKYRRGYNQFGQKHGIWISYNYDGSQHMYGRFKHGDRHGTWCAWKTSVNCGPRDEIDVTHITNYRNGRLDGAHAIYTVDGILQRACCFFRGNEWDDEWRIIWYRRTELGSVLYYEYGPDETEFNKVQTNDKYYDLAYDIFGRAHPLFGDLRLAFDFRGE